MHGRTFCVIPYEARDNAFFVRVFEDSVSVHKDATERPATKGAEEVLPFSLVLSPAHQLVNQIVAPLLHAIGERRNAFLSVALTGTASSVSEEGCEVAMELYSNLLPSLFRSAMDCTIARISVVLITPGVSPGELAVDDVLSGCSVERGYAEAQFEVVERDSSVSRWSDVLRLLSARHESKASASSSLLVTACMEGYGTLRVLETGSHMGLLQLFSQTLALKPMTPRTQNASSATCYSTLLSDLIGVGDAREGTTVAHFVVIPDPSVSDRISRRILRFVSSLHQVRGDRTPGSASSHGKAIDELSCAPRSAASPEGGEGSSRRQDDGYRWGTELLVDPGLMAASGSSSAGEHAGGASARTLIRAEATKSSEEPHPREAEMHMGGLRPTNPNRASSRFNRDQRLIDTNTGGGRGTSSSVVECFGDPNDTHDRTGKRPAFSPGLKYGSVVERSGSSASVTPPVSTDSSSTEAGRGMNRERGEGSLMRRPSNHPSVQKGREVGSSDDVNYRGSPQAGPFSENTWPVAKAADGNAGFAAGKSREQALLDKLMSSEYTNREVAATLAQARTELRHTIVSLEETQSALQKSQESVIDAHARIASLKSENSELSATIARLLKKVDTLEKERAEHARSLSSVISERDAAHGVTVSKNAEVKELRKKIKTLEAREAQRVRQRALDALDTPRNAARDIGGGQRSQVGSAVKSRRKTAGTADLEGGRTQARSPGDAEESLGGSLAQVIAKLREKNTQLENEKVKLKEEIEYQRNLACATANSRNQRRGGVEEGSVNDSQTRWDEGIVPQPTDKMDGTRGYRARDEVDGVTGGCGTCNTMSRKLQYFATELARARKEKDRLQELVLTSQSHRWNSQGLADASGNERTQRGGQNDTIMRVLSSMEAGCASLRAQLACLSDEVQRSNHAQSTSSSVSASTSLIASAEHLKQHDSALSVLEQALSDIGGKECIQAQHLPRTATAADTETLARAVDFEENRCRHLMAFIPTFMQLAVALEHMKLRMQRA